MLRRNALRAIYFASLINYSIYAYWYLSSLMPAFLHSSGITLPNGFGSVIWVFAIPAYLVVATPLAILAVRPMWWGKLLMLLLLLNAPFAWLFAKSDFLGAEFHAQMRAVANFAYVFALMAIVQQIIDPTIWRPTSTWLSKDYPPPWPFGRSPRTSP